MRLNREDEEDEEDEGEEKQDTGDIEVPKKTLKLSDLLK